MKAAVLLPVLALLVSAHPGEDHRVEALERRAALEFVGKRSLAHCASALAERGVNQRNQLRRRAFLEAAAQQQKLRKRSFDDVLAKNHKSNLTGITKDTDPSELFKGEHLCTLHPETTEGPYFVKGELIRQDVRDNEPGVPLYVDIQIIDTNTCSPLEGAALDFWHCNSTGVYSGVSASGTGNSDADDSNLDATFNRGIQETSSDGVAQFLTTFPGHYTGRATHIHIMSHSPGKWTKLANNTITGNVQNSHVGQLFFDDSLIAEVEKLAPYNTNTQALTTNKEDFIMVEESADVDPVVEYVLLGDSLEDGILAWVSVAVNASASYTARPAVNYTEDGGVVNPGGMGGGPGGGAGGPGCGGGPPPGMNFTGGPPMGMRNGSFPGGPGNGTAGGFGGMKCDNATDNATGNSTDNSTGAGSAPQNFRPSGVSESAILPSATPVMSSEAAPSATPSAGGEGQGQCSKPGRPWNGTHGNGTDGGHGHRLPSQGNKMRPNRHQSHWENKEQSKWQQGQQDEDD